MFEELKARYHLIIAGIGVVLALISVSEYCGITNIFSLSDPPYSVANIIGGLGAIASVFLSAGLVYLYNKQHGVLTEQKKLSEYQQSALLKIDDHRIIPYEKTKNIQDNLNTGIDTDNLVLYQTEFVEVDITNIGLAPAHNLQVELYIQADNEHYSIAPPLVEGEVEDVISDLHGRNIDTIFHNTEGNSIQAESDSQTYTVPLITLTEVIPDGWKEGCILHRWPPASAILRCAKQNVDSDFSIYLLLWSKDGSGTRGPQLIRVVGVSPEELTDLEDIDTEDIELDGEESVADEFPDLNEIFGDIGDSIPEPLPDLEHPDER
jgi:hypothetical protein